VLRTTLVRRTIVFVVVVITAVAIYIGYSPTPALAASCTAGSQCADGTVCVDKDKCSKTSAQRCSCSGSQCSFNDDSSCKPQLN
jgi:hypothetical protein